MKNRAFCAALVVGLALFAIAPLAKAQQALVVDTCGTLPANLRVGGAKQIYQDKTGKQCVAASVSASITPFTPGTSGARGTPLTVTTSDSSGSLPTNGGAVAVYNVGSNPMYCNVNGIAATTADPLITASGGWFNFGIPSGITTLHCIATGGSTTANSVGGSGLATGTGGGSGGGGGGAVTQSGTWTVQPGNTPNTVAWKVDGSAVTQPVSAASLPLPTGAATSANQATEITSLGTIATNSGTQATAANQATANTSLATLHTDMTTLNTTAGSPGTLSSQYPATATPLTASATGTTAATTATLAGTSGKTTYICGYSIRANATANTNVTDTITGVISGTMSSALWVPANTAGLGVDEQIFTPCIPASTTNTAIAAVSGAPGAGGVVTVKAWGYQL